MSGTVHAARSDRRSNEFGCPPVSPSMKADGFRAALVGLAVLVVACGGPMTSSPDAVARTPTPPQAPAESKAPAASASAGPAASDDLATLLETLERSHPDPFHGVSRDEFVAALAAYEESLPTLTPEEAVVGLMRVWAMLSREGRDGHQFAVPAEAQRRPGAPDPGLRVRRGALHHRCPSAARGARRRAHHGHRGHADRPGAGRGGAARAARRPGDGARVPSRSCCSAPRSCAVWGSSARGP